MSTVAIRFAVDYGTWELTLTHADTRYLLSVLQRYGVQLRANLVSPTFADTIYALTWDPQIFEKSEVVAEHIT